MANKHMNGSSSLIIRETQIKMRCHLIPNRMAITEKRKITGIRKDVQ